MRSGWRPNPVVGLGACAVIGLAALAARDRLTPVLLLLPVALLLPALPRAGRARLPPALALIAISALGVGFSAALLAPGPGLAGERGLAMALRVLAIALPGVLLAVLTDPTHLADALVGQLRLPARFAYGALAALRLLPLLQQEWRMIGLARRARGVHAGANPVRAVEQFGSRCFALLVAAVRRSGQLATAMDARGFDSGVPRTATRDCRVALPDLALLAAALLLALGATALSVAAGSWQSAWA